MITIIGHRGAPYEAPENTLESFEAAALAGVGWVELDVQLTRDKVPVVFHDPGLLRMTSRRALLARTDYADLPPVAGGGQIPRLDTVLRAMAARRVGVYVEIKEKSPKELQPILAVCREAGGDQVLSSFSLPVLVEVRRHWPEIPLMPLFARPCLSLVGRCRGLGSDSAGLALRLATPTRIRSLSLQGIRTFVYTVNDPDRAAAMEGWGAAGVFTDFPRLVTGSPMTP